MPERDERCPKCGFSVTGESCPRCGLVFAKFDPAVLEEDVPRALEQQWADLETNWSDRSAHGLFVQRALEARALGYAARCYRQRGEDQLAQEQIERIGKQMEAMLASTLTPSGRSRKSGRLALVTLLVVAIAAIVALLFLGFNTVK